MPEPELERLGIMPEPELERLGIMPEPELQTIEVETLDEAFKKIREITNTPSISFFRVKIKIKALGASVTIVVEKPKALLPTK